MFSQQTIDFLEALQANNTLDWFEDNRSTYLAAVRDPAREFAETLSRLLEASGQGPVTPKIFRINRDLRFSKDKTPYNTHVHMAFRPADTRTDSPAWMVGLEPGKLTLGAGIMGFSPQQLEAWRKCAAGPAGAILERDLDQLLKQGCSLSAPDLIRVPKTYPEDHPRGDLLRRKGLAVWWHTGDTKFACGSGGPAYCQEKLQTFAPIMIWLSKAMQAVQAAR